MKIYNTLSGKKEEFVPADSGKVKMYVCGPTVYSYIHIGNARTFVFFDTARRYLMHKGYDVNYVQNYTDIDDKIIKTANAENISVNDVAKRYIAEAEKDFEGFSILKPTNSPRVTQEMPEIIKMISDLISGGYAYEKNGSVFYDTGAFSGYGKLSKKHIDELNAGARIEINDEKKNPMDFVLWKPAKEGEPSWESPWGAGRPGWHIECSVMAKKYLGETIDIHAGGEDLIFPHHENEIAQSEAANSKPFAKYWAHVRFVNVDNKKMGKSEGNFFTVRDITKKYPYAVMRFFILSGHYRTPINFSAELMEAAQNSYNRVKNCVKSLSYFLAENEDKPLSPLEAENIKAAEDFKQNFEKAMDDDFNTADAIAAVFDYVRFANSTSSADSSKEYVKLMRDGILFLCGILGIEIEKEEEVTDAEIEALIEQRQAARKAKDFKTADEIRNKLLEMGIVLEDTRQGVRYAKK